MIKLTARSIRSLDFFLLGFTLPAASRPDTVLLMHQSVSSGVP